MLYNTRAGGVASPTRRRLLAAAGMAGLAPAAWGQAAPRKPAQKHWRLLINEAVTGESNILVLTSRYRPFADYLGEQARSVIEVEPVVSIDRFVGLAKAQPGPELVFGKSVNQLAKLVRDHHYQPLVRRADPYKAAFIVHRDSAIRTLADAGRARAKVLMPDEFAATTAVARAELRHRNVGAVEVVHTKYQEAVAQQVKSGFAQVGVVNPTTARKWAEDGGRVIAETQPVVNWSVLAGPGLAPDVAAQLRDALLAMNSRAPAVMAQLGVKEWARAERQDYLKLLEYTKE